MTNSLKTIKDIIEESFNEEGIKVDKKVPNVLYKYTSFEDMNDLERRINSLAKHKVWISRMGALNDPFEGKILYIQPEVLAEYGYTGETVKEILDSVYRLGESMPILSLAATNLSNDMPLWAHYANNHNGYCLEYEIIDNTFLYPVIYEEKRYAANSIITNLVHQAYKMIKEGDRRNNSISPQQAIILQSHFCKHKSWAYEKEVRLYYPKILESTCSGFLIDEKEVGLKLKGVYLGVQWSREQIERFINSTKHLECNVYQMKLDTQTEEFRLVPNRIK